MEATSESLVEREQELAVLEALTEEAAGGSGRVVVIEAPAGLGKTALLHRVELSARARGVRVLSARARELEQGYSFALVGQLLEPALATASREERARLLDGAAALAAPLLGYVPRDEDADELPSATVGGPVAPSTTYAGAPPDPGYAALHGLYWLVANIVAEGPVLVSIDDLHWADSASLRFLSFLEARVEGMALLVVCARRPHEPGTARELLEHVGSDARAARIRPRPLSLEGAGRLLGDAFEAAPDPEFVGACHSACAGNPFYLEVLAAELREDGGEPIAAQAARVPELAPAALSRTILLRLARLPPAAAELAKAVAVLGDDVPIEDAAELASLSEDAAREAASALSRVSVLRHAERLSFVHPIVRAAVYEEIGAPERSQAHRRAAALLTARDAAPDRIASQLVRAAPEGDAETVELLRAAAEQAGTRGASDAAVAYLRRALAEPPRPEARARVLRELGVAEFAAAEPAAVEHLREAHATEADPVARAEAALELGRVAIPSRRPAEAIEILASAAAQTRDLAPELSARLAIEEVSARYLLPGAGVRERLEQIAEHVEAGSAIEPLVLVMLAFETFKAGEPAWPLAARAIEGGTLLAHEGPASQTFVGAVNILLFSDRLEHAGETIEDGMRAARLGGSAAGFATMSGCRATLHARLGPVPDAEADARAALGVSAEGGMQTLEPHWLAELVESQAERGEHPEAAAELERRGLAAELPAGLGGAFLLCARGRLRVESGIVRRGLDDLEASGRTLEQFEIFNPAFIPWRARAALALHALGERERALAEAREDLARAERAGVASAQAAALRACGLIEGGDAGIERLRAAVAMLDPLPEALERGRALIDLGAALRRAGHRTEARDPLHAGLELAEAAGALALADRARTELAAAGGRPREPLRTGLDALTASERRVAEMAAQGLSNAEIAQALFVTLRTVESHLTHAYGKLGISRRFELPGALGEREEA
jgi:DNA-binding CsgD family transcriptional regulator